MQGYVYHRKMELWMRVSDGRFALSDLYPPPARFGGGTLLGPLSKIDSVVSCSGGGARAPAAQSSRAFRRDRRDDGVGADGGGEEDDGRRRSRAITRSHCEDRMACALALRSPDEFRTWLGRYVRALAAAGDEGQLRLLADALLGAETDKRPDGRGDGGRGNVNGGDGNFVAGGGGACWWLSDTPAVLGLDRREALRTVVIPAMGKNRALQRLTNEIAVDAEALL